MKTEKVFLREGGFDFDVFKIEQVIKKINENLESMKIPQFGTGLSFIVGNDVCHMAFILDVFLDKGNIGVTLGYYDDNRYNNVPLYLVHRWLEEKVTEYYRIYIYELLQPLGDNRDIDPIMESYNSGVEEAQNVIIDMENLNGFAYIEETLCVLTFDNMITKLEKDLDVEIPEYDRKSPAFLLGIFHVLKAESRSLKYHRK